MKLQWSIQSSHTQLVLNQVVHLNYRNENICPPTRKLITYLWSFSFGFFTIHNNWSFWINTSHFEIDAWNFWYKSLSLFPSRILVCATAFATHYLFSFWDLHLLSSLSNKNKKCGKIYRHKSTHVSKPTWLLSNHSWQA